LAPLASGVAIVELPVDATGLAAVAVSVEPAGGSRAPTTTPKFIRKLS
jgi:anti-sigma-K factor RskA